MFLYNLQVAIKMHREHIKPDVNVRENRRDNIINWQSNWHDHMIQNEEKQNNNHKMAIKKMSNTDPTE